MPLTGLDVTNTASKELKTTLQTESLPVPKGRAVRQDADDSELETELHYTQETEKQAFERVKWLKEEEMTVILSSNGSNWNAWVEDFDARLDFAGLVTFMDQTDEDFRDRRVFRMLSLAILGQIKKSISSSLWPRVKGKTGSEAYSLLYSRFSTTTQLAGVQTGIALLSIKQTGSLNEYLAQLTKRKGLYTNIGGEIPELLEMSMLINGLLPEYQAAAFRSMQTATLTVQQMEEALVRFADLKRRTEPRTELRGRKSHANFSKTDRPKESSFGRTNQLSQGQQGQQEGAGRGPQGYKPRLQRPLY